MKREHPGTHCETPERELEELLDRVGKAPVDAVLWYRVGRMRTKLGDPDAIDAYQTVLRLDPSHSRAWNRLGLEYYRRRRTDLAVFTLEERAAVAGRYGAPYLILRRLLRVQEAREARVTALNEVVRAHAGDARSWHELGYTLIALERPDEGVFALEAAVQADPRLGDAWFDLCRQRALVGQARPAREALRRARAAGCPRTFGLRIAMGLGRLEPGEEDDLVEDGRTFPDQALASVESSLAGYDRAVELALRPASEQLEIFGQLFAEDPWNQAAGYGLVSNLRGEGRHREAAMSYVKASEAGRECGTGWDSLGEDILASWMRDEATAAFRTGLGVDPQSSAILANWSMLVGELGETQEALRMLGRALELDPDRADLHFNRSLQWLQLFHAEHFPERGGGFFCWADSPAPGRWGPDRHSEEAWSLLERAHGALRRALSLKPDHLLAQVNLMALRIKAGQHGEALRDHQQRRMKPSFHPVAAHNAAVAALRSGLPELALSEVQALLECQEPDAETLKLNLSIHCLLEDRGAVLSALTLMEDSKHWSAEQIESQRRSIREDGWTVRLPGTARSLEPRFCGQGIEIVDIPA